MESLFPLALLLLSLLRTDAFNTASFSMADTNYPIPAGAVFVSPSGNDANAGTEAAPLKNPVTAVSRAASGGTIVFRAGLYYEAELGKITKKVTLQPYPHEKAYLLGSAPVSGWVLEGAIWRKSGWTNPLEPTTCPAEAIDPSYPNACMPEQVFVAGNPLSQVSSKAAVTTGKFFMDTANSALYIGTNPTNQLVEVSTKWRAFQFDTGAEGSVVRGLGIAHYAPHWDESQLAAVISNAASVTFESNLFTQNAGTALGIFKPDNIVRSNYIGYNGYRGVNGNRCDRTQFVGNTVDNNNQEHFRIDSCGGYCTVAGIKVAHTDNLVVAYNYFRNNIGTGFWCDLGCTDAVVTKNVATGNLKHGLYYEVSSRAIIASNIIANNKYNGLKISGSDQVRVYNNDFVKNGNNLGIFDDPRLPADADPNYSAVLGLSWNTANTEIRNNLFSNGVSTFLDGNETPQKTSPQMISAMDHNGWYRASSTSPPNLVHWCDSGCADFSTHQNFVSATGRDAVPPSIVVENAANPFFVNEAAGDYNLLASSPAQSSGAALPSDIASALGVASSPVDMGALDWRGKTSAPAPQPTSLSIVASDDATIMQGTPTTNYGTNAELIADVDPRSDFLIKFSISGIGTRAVTKALLVLTATDAGKDGATVNKATHNNWNQGSVTWNSAPWIESPALATLPLIADGVTYSVDVTSMVSADGIYSIRVIQPSVEGIRFSSLEGASKPRLDITVQ
ncbi:right handed beta helix region domain-containing protein [Ditylenchus destructor]|uniref:Right handed beta helix region domain-containing protein n=1 Tax=Ditylenchus destructor TaxID=166010 RepID=A0AAD4MV96_9BILA|nr:right handed beta helix region domain-containing protein [Ditylenchus destructor]